MSNNDWTKDRKRNRTLIIVEGNSEKNNLFRLIFRAFPEMDINEDNVWVYGTNIFELYRYIIDQNGGKWEDDIDLPLIISKKLNMEKRYRRDFSNIILVFDYERQAPQFSEEKLIRMQQYFQDSSDMGKLYINYPMLESYLHFRDIPDSNYLSYKVTSDMKSGGIYKDIINRVSVIKKELLLYDEMHDILKNEYGITERTEQCIDRILNICSFSKLKQEIQDVFSMEMPATLKTQAIEHLSNKLGKYQYLQNGETYLNYVRRILQVIVLHNIQKALFIEGIERKYEKEELTSSYDEVDLNGVLVCQNECSREETGYVWVINTSIFFIMDYNSKLIS